VYRTSTLFGADNHNRSFEAEGIVRKTIFYGWWIVAAISVILIFGVASAFYTVSVFLEPIEATLGWTKTQISLGFTIAALLGAAVSPFVGLAISKFGVKNVLIFGAVATGLALALLSQIRQLWHYYTLSLLLALGISCLGLISGTTCISHWFEKRRGTATGIIFAASGVGGMVMVFAASRAVGILDWRPTYMLLGAIVFLIVVPVILIVMKNKPEDVGLEPDGGLISNGTVKDSPVVIGFNLKEAAGTLPYWLMAFLMLCYAVAFGSMTQHAIALLRSLGAGEPSMVWSLTLGISVLGRLLFGLLADRCSKRALIAVTWLFHVIGLTSALAIPNALPLVFAFALFYGIGQGAFGTVFPVLLGELFGTEHFSKLYGTVLLFQAIGFSVGAVLFGKIYDSIGSYGLAIQLVAAVSLICFFATAAIRQPTARFAGRMARI
jgi:MFS family permease